MFRTKVPQRDDDISKYSTISKSWRDRTQFHHFNQLVFWGQEGLDRWRAATAADPNGISRHVRSLVWWEIETLEGFGDHILAFTKVEATSFESCTIFRSLSGLSLLKPLGSSLLCLDINGENSPEGVTWFLTFLPHLRRFDSLANCVSDPHERSPFFKGLRNKLTVTALHARGSPEAVNGWISSSDLKHLHFNLHSPLDGVCLHVSGSFFASPDYILSRSQSRPPGPLRIHVPRNSTTPSCSGSPNTRRNRWALDILFGTFYDRSGVVHRRRTGRPSELEDVGRASVSTCQAIQGCAGWKEP